MNSHATLIPVLTGVRTEQTVVAITPDNGASLTQAPGQVELTFAETVAGAEVSASTTDPQGSTTEAEVSVQGSTVQVPVADVGPGDYTVQFQVDQLSGSTVFTQLSPGQPAPVEGSSYGPLLVGAVLLALLLVTALTLRGWRRQ